MNCNILLVLGVKFGCLLMDILFCVILSDCIIRFVKRELSFFWCVFLLFVKCIEGVGLRFGVNDDGVGVGLDDFDGMLLMLLLLLVVWVRDKIFGVCLEVVSDGCVDIVGVDVW